MPRFVDYDPLFGAAYFMVTCESKKFYELPNLEGEEWKDVEGFEGYYQVSSEGRLKSLERTIKVRGFERFIDEKILVWTMDRRGYHRVLVSKKGKQSNRAAHRLVATAFIPNPENKKTVNHKNGIKTDNRVENLEWNTNYENIGHAIANELIKKGVKKRKLSIDQVKEIKYGCHNMLHREIAAMYGINQDSIWSIRSGKTWKNI